MQNATARCLKQIVRIGLHQLGGLHIVRRHNRKRFRILMYHRFSPALYPGVQDSLARQCAYLKRWFHPLPLGDIGESLLSGRQLPPGALAITVDDGYRDFLTDAFPVFEAYRIPVTVFLVSDFIDGTLWPWWDQVAYAVQHTHLASVRLAVIPDTAMRVLASRTPEQREAAVTAICADVLKVPNRTRLAFLQALPELFQVDIPRKAPPDFAGLDWEEVRSLARSGVDFGAHTKTHPILSRVEDSDRLAEEIGGSKARIEQMLGRSVPHFCYPNGQAADFNSATVQAVERFGFQTAVTTEPGLNGATQDRYRLRRLHVGPTLKEFYFREEVSGLRAT